LTDISQRSTTRSRPTKWLERNPLVVVRAVNVPGYYCDNEPLLFARLRAVTALLAMLAALQPSETTRGQSLFSSSHINNWQTLDIHHYIVLFNTLRHGGELSGDCIPIHSSRTIAVDASDLNIDLDSTFWSRRRQRVADGLHAAVDHVYGGYLMHGRHLVKGDARSRVYRKTFDSLSYFKQSLSRSENDWRATVSLLRRSRCSSLTRIAKGSRRDCSAGRSCSSAVCAAAATTSEP